MAFQFTAAPSSGFSTSSKPNFTSVGAPVSMASNSANASNSSNFTQSGASNQPTPFGTLNSNQSQLGSFGSSFNISGNVPAGGNFMQGQVPLQSSEYSIEFPGETTYERLPPPFRAEIDRTYSEMKFPLNQGIEEINCFQESSFSQSNITTPLLSGVRNEMKLLCIRVIHIENIQRQLHAVIIPYVEHLRKYAQTAHLQGTLGLKQIRSHIPQANVYLPGAIPASGDTTMMQQHLSKWFLLVAEQLEQRLQQCIAKVSCLEKQLSINLSDVCIDEVGNSATPIHSRRNHVLNPANADHSEGWSRIHGNYGQLQRIGPKQALSLLKTQMDGFLNLSQVIAQVHCETDSLREAFKQLLRSSTNRSSNEVLFDPFLAADRNAECDERRMEQRLGNETEQYLKQQRNLKINQTSTSGLSATAAPAAAATVPVGSTNFSFGGSSAPTTSSTSSGGAPTSTISFSAPTFGGTFGAGGSTGAPSNKKGKGKK